MLTRRDFLRTTAAATIFGSARTFAADNPLKITAVEPVLIRGGKCFVLIRTDAAITGVGEVSPMNSRAAAKLIETAFTPQLIGKNPLDINTLWEDLFLRTYKQGPMGLQPEALAGIDIALWDILGKVAKMPVYQLLGGKRRDSVRMYSSIGGAARLGEKEMVRRAAKSVAEGFTAVKIRMDYGPASRDHNPDGDLRMLAAVRKEIGPDVELLYDVNNGYTAHTAIRVGRRLADLNVIHYEEPVAQTDYDGYKKLVTAVDVPVAAGEHEYTRWQFRDLIRYADPDILQPDLVKCAGISEGVKIAALASAHHKLMVPHQTQPTIGTAANLHFTAAFVENDIAQEMIFDGLHSELREMFTNPPVFQDGRLTVPTGPGLGLTLIESKLKEFRADSQIE